MKLYIMGDLHGQYRAFFQRLDQLGNLCTITDEGTEDMLILLGDYIDGPGGQSGILLEKIYTLQTCFPDRVIVLRGNHEQMLLEWLETYLGPESESTDEYGLPNWSDWLNTDPDMETFRSLISREQWDFFQKIAPTLSEESMNREAARMVYFSYLCSLAETLPSIDDRSRFADQANVALAFFAENADMSQEVVEAIQSCQERINQIFNGIYESQQAQEDQEREKAKLHNNDCIKKLYALKDDLRATTTQTEFDAVLARIAQEDSALIKDAFTPEQSNAYDDLTKSHTDVISAKMRELEFKRNTEYNKQAVEAFTKAFSSFRNNEGKYKNQTQLFSLVSTTLFAYDASRLFNETLIYYNHVYSYIFSKLDDEGKLALTRFSIECERKLR